MERQSLSLWDKLAQMFGKKAPAPAVAAKEEESAEMCCNGAVHIAYRGVSDDKMYMSYNRKWAEVKFFRQHGLRVFCADCRRRLL